MEAESKRRPELRTEKEVQLPSLDEQLKIAKREARRFAQLSGADLEGAEQEALAAMLEACRGIRLGNRQVANIPGYLTVAARYAVQWFIWTNRSPLKHTDRTAVAYEVGGLVRVEETVLEEHTAPEPTPDEEVETGRWRTLVQIRFAELLLDQPELDQEIAWRTLLCGEPQKSVAREVNVDEKAVYVVHSRVRQRILKDPEMRDLFRRLRRY